MSRHQIPSERKVLYYGGVVLTAIGFILFFSTFVTFGANMGRFNHSMYGAQSEFTRALAGIVLIGIGSAMRTVGARGLAGSGVILDPEKARRDIEPWSRMVGGAVKDALSETDLGTKPQKPSATATPEIKVRCQQCKSLNDESAKFCNQCGNGL